MSTVLVTGVAGFIASEVAFQLLEEGINVIGVDNMNDYYDVSLKELRIERLNQNKNFTFYKADIENQDLMNEIFTDNELEVVYNLAARAGVRSSMEEPHKYVSTNLTGTLVLLDLMKEFKVEKMVLASTSSLYAGQEMPFSEDLAVNTPISPYAASKKAAEMMAHSYHYLYDIDITVVRYFTVYGPYGRPDMCIFRFIKWIDSGEELQLFGDGEQSRDFTYVSDIAHGTIVAGRKKIGFEIINLGGGKEPVTLNEIISDIEEFFGKKSHIKYFPFHKADIKETRADISKAKRLLDWEPRCSLGEGLQKTLEWYVKNRDFCSEVKL